MQGHKISCHINGDIDIMRKYITSENHKFIKMQTVMEKGLWIVKIIFSPRNA